MARGLKAPELAAKAEVSASLVNMIERGDRGSRLGAEPSLRLARALNCPVEWLVTGEGQAPEGVTVEPDPVELLHAEGGRERGAA